MVAAHTVKFSPSSNRPWRTVPAATRAFSYSVVDDDTHVSGGTPSEYQVNDVIISRTTGALVDHGAQILTEVPCTFEVVDGYESIAAVSAGGRVTRLADGTAKIRITSKVNGIQTRSIASIDVYREGGAVVDVLSRYATGSLAKHFCDQIDGRIEGGDAATKKVMYSSIVPETSTAVRNSGCWTQLGSSPIDTSCLCIYSTGRQYRQGGVVVAPNIVLGADHNRPGNGDTYSCVSMAGAWHTRTIIDRMAVGNGDLFLSILDSDFPAAIKPAKVLPANWANYLPSLAMVNGILCPVPMLTTDYQKQALVNEMIYAASSAAQVLFRHANESDQMAGIRADYFEGVIAGDSASGVCHVLNNEVVVRTTYGSDVAGPDASNAIAALNAAIATLGGSHPLTQVSLSAFTDYS